MESLIRFVDRQHNLVVALSLLLTAACTFIVATRWNIDSDFKALLPQESPAAQAMTEVGERIGSGSALFVVLDSPDQQANIQFAEKYAEKLREMDEVALAHFHNDKAFFDKYALMFLQAEDLAEIKVRLKRAIKDAKKRANPLFVDLGGPKKKKETFETADIEAKYEGQQAQDGYKEYLVSDDGYALTIIVRFVETSTNLAATNDLIERVEKTGKDLDPASFHPEMHIELGGGLVKRKAEYDSLLDDVRASAVFTILGLFGVIGIYFRRLRAVVLVLGPLVMSVLWTLAAALLIFEALTTITAFIFAILLGLGIDFSIHLLSSYDTDRATGMARDDALVATYRGTGSATLIGAATTFGVFVVLAFAQFRGLSQFGVVASIGVLAAAAAMTITLPALIATFDKWAPANPTERRLPVDADRWSRGQAAALLGVAAMITVGAVISIPNIIFEENFRAVGEINWPWSDRDEDREYALHKAEYRGKKFARHIFQQAREVRKQRAPETFVMDREQKDVGDKYSSALGALQTSQPTIVLFDDAESTNQVYRALRDAQDSGAVDTLKGVASIWAFMPTNEEQKARLEQIREIAAILDKEGTRYLDDEQKKQVEELRPKLDVDLFTVYDLPPWTKRLFKEAGKTAKAPADGEDFAFEYTVFLNENVDSKKGKEARRFLNDAGRIAESTGVDLRIASPSMVYVAMLDNIKTDGLRMMGWALLAVLLILTSGFRSPRHAIVSLLPLTFGIVWMLGSAAFLGIKLDFFNVIILPVIIGIGVDDGVHFYHHWLESGSVGDALQRVGASVTMTSITSMIGFGGLAVTDYAGLASIGHLAICGIAATWIATLVVMPAALRLMPAPVGHAPAHGEEE